MPFNIHISMLQVALAQAKLYSIYTCVHVAGGTGSSHSIYIYQCCKCHWLKPNYIVYIHVSMLQMALAQATQYTYIHVSGGIGSSQAIYMYPCFRWHWPKPLNIRISMLLVALAEAKLYTYIHVASGTGSSQAIYMYPCFR